MVRRNIFPSSEFLSKHPVHLILGTTGLGRGKSSPEMPQVPIQDIQNKSWDWYIYQVRLEIRFMSITKMMNWSRWKCRMRWERNVGKVCQTGALRHLQKVIKNLRTKQNTTFASDRQIVAYFMAYTTGLWACPTKTSQSWDGNCWLTCISIDACGGEVPIGRHLRCITLQSLHLDLHPYVTWNRTLHVTCQIYTPWHSNTMT